MQDHSCPISPFAKKMGGELQARVILYEQFQEHKTFDQAFGSVKSELGPNVMSSKSAKKWFKKFEQDDFDVAKGASRVDRILIKNGNYLKTKRAYCCEIVLGQDARVSGMHGKDGRFQLINSYGWWMLDTFNEQKRKATISMTTVPGPKHSNGCFRSFQFYFLNETTFIASTYRHDNPMICGGTFDFAECRFEFTDLIDDPAFSSFVMDIRGTRPVGVFYDSRVNENWNGDIYLHGYTSISLNSNGRLCFGEFFELPENIDELLIQHDDKFFGMITPKGDELGEFSASTGVELTKHKVEPHKKLSQSRFNARQRQWFNDKYIVAGHGRKTSLILIFDFPTMKWVDPKIEIGRSMRGFTFGGHNLIIVDAEPHPCCARRQFYRFVVGRPDSLLNLAWMTIRRRAHFQPQFFDYVLSRLPAKFPLRCPWPKEECSPSGEEWLDEMSWNDDESYDEQDLMDGVEFSDGGDSWDEVYSSDELSDTQ